MTRATHQFRSGYAEHSDTTASRYFGSKRVRPHGAEFLTEKKINNYSIENRSLLLLTMTTRILSAVCIVLAYFVTLNVNHAVVAYQDCKFSSAKAIKSLDDDDDCR